MKNVTDFLEFLNGLKPELMPLARGCGNSDEQEEQFSAFMVSMCRRWQLIANAGDPRAYTRTSFVHFLRDHERRGKTTVSVYAKYASIFRQVQSRDPSQNAEHRELVKRLGEVFRNLTPRQQTVVDLYLYGGLSQAEIARVLGISGAAVSQLIQRAFKKLENDLEGFNG